MPTKMGRPLKGEHPKDLRLQLRINADTAQDLQECAEALNISKTEVVERSISDFHKKTVKKEE